MPVLYERRAFLHMPNHKIEDVEGIGKAIGAQLREAGIADTDTLLASAKTPAQRKALAEASGVAETQILKFANMVDLYRVHGVGSEFGELLEAAGVDTVPELAKRNPETLAKRLAALNQEQDLVRHVPQASSVTRWVEHAKTLSRMIEY
jgi:predicted flap endonuclease-1-like 5' DNA nuclease